MEVMISMFYVVFAWTLFNPPTEFVSAGFTIPQIFEGYLGSENTNFIAYHMKRITITALIHSALPLGYIFSLWCGGETGQWMLSLAGFTAIFPTLMCYKIATWWERDKSKHPVVRALLPYVMEGSDWRVVASDFNFEYRGVDKMVVNLNATSKLIATQTWLIKVDRYSFHLVKQAECNLVATATDSHMFTNSGEGEVQYVNVEVNSMRDDVRGFSFRIPASTLRELQPNLQRPVHVPDHISLLPTLVERFVKVFRQLVDQNPVYYSEQEIEQCIGCMQAPADVKLDKRCGALEPPPEPAPGEPPALVLLAHPPPAPPPPALAPPDLGPLAIVPPARGPPPCQQCNCRVLWCCSCMARWWATRAGLPPSHWLMARGSCPVCRAPFCLADVRPARIVPPQEAS